MLFRDKFGSLDFLRVVIVAAFILFGIGFLAFILVKPEITNFSFDYFQFIAIK